MESAKKKIQQEIKIWMIVNKHEFDLFKQAFKRFQDRDNLKTKWAELEGAEFIERHAYSMPTSLEDKISLALDSSELEWYKSKKGALWIVKNYPVFSATYKA